MNNQKLINQFKALKLDYLDYDGYNEVEFHQDNEETIELYDKMFNAFIQPVFSRLKEMQYIYADEVIFHYFYLDDDTKEIMGAFYNPQVHVQVSNVNYRDEVEKVLSYIIK